MVNMDIQLIAIDPSFGGGANLSNALSLNNNVRTVFRQKDPKMMYKLVKDGLYGYHNIKPFDNNIIIGANCLVETIHLLRGKISVILTDSYYLENHVKVNELILKNKINVYCMADMAYLLNEIEFKPYYQPFNLNLTKVTKEVSVCHSPYSEIKRKLKGSDLIKRVSNELSLPYIEITNKTWDESIQIKNKSKFFIDQIVSDKIDKYSTNGYVGGVGKSGLEAMLCGCLVFTSGHPIINNYIPPPPIIWVTNETLKNRLVDMTTNEVNETIKTQQAWANKYTSYEFVSTYLINNS